MRTKYLVLIPDGMADQPVEALGNRTPMEAAVKPCMDVIPAQRPMPFMRSTADITVPLIPHFSLKLGKLGFLPGLQSQAELAGFKPRARRASFTG